MYIYQANPIEIHTVVLDSVYECMIQSIDYRATYNQTIDLILAIPNI